jgi:hypothetical protein
MGGVFRGDKCRESSHVDEFPEGDPPIILTPNQPNAVWPLDELTSFARGMDTWGLSLLEDPLSRGILPHKFCNV